MDSTVMTAFAKADKEMGYEGEELRKWVTEQCEAARELRAKEREQRQRELEMQHEREKELKEIEYTKQLEREKELKEIEYTKQLEREKELKQMEIQSQVEIEKAKLQVEKEKMDIEREKVAIQKQQLESKSSLLDSAMLPAFNENKDNFEAYIARFESFATLRKWPKEDWAMQLNLLLSGETLDTFFGLPNDQQANYEAVKKALLRRFSLTEQGFRQELYGTSVKSGETPTQFMARLERLFQSWVQAAYIEKTFDGLRSLILKEEFFKRCNSDLVAYLREKSVTDIDGVATTAQRYLDAYGGTLEENREKSNTSGDSTSNDIDGNNFKSNQTNYTTNNIQGKQLNKSTVDGSEITRLQCNICGKPGHSENICWYREQNEWGQSKDVRKANGERSRDEIRNRTDQGTIGSTAITYSVICCDICKKRGHHKENCYFARMGYKVQRCFGCGSHKHFVRRCPVVKHATLTSDDTSQGYSKEAYVIRREGNIPAEELSKQFNVPISEGRVNGQQVLVLRDSGFSHAAVHTRLVRPEQYLDKQETIILMDGTVRQFQKANIHVDTGYYKGSLEVVVMENPVADLILGNIQDGKVSKIT